MSLLDAIQLLGGVGLFLYGMTAMSTGLKNAAGDRLRDILEKVTGNRVAAVGIGILVTLLIQSSSATDMMVIGFVNAGLMNLMQAFGVIMGANIGTTVTAQITAFNLTAYAPLLLFTGCVMYLFLKKNMVRHIGSVIMGFGMLFVGVGIMKQAIGPLSRSQGFAAFLYALDHPLMAMLFGIGFTALLQSSSSSVVIFQAFAVQGLLSYHQTVWLVIGAAVGSVAPNLLAGLTTGREGKRTALLNLLFNLFRALLVGSLITIFPQILDGIAGLSPGDVARQVANAHTIFAVVSVLVALPLSGLFVALAQRLMPPLPEELRSRDLQRLAYLGDVQKIVPAVAMKQAQLEVSRMGRFARDNLESALIFFFDPQQEQRAKEIEEMEAAVDYLNHAITDKLVLLRSRSLSDRDVFRLTKMTQVVSNFERISDHAENIMEFGERMLANHAEITPDGLQELRTMGDAVLQTMDLAIRVFNEERFDLLPRVEALEQKVDDMQDAYIQHHIERLMQTQCNPLGGVIFTDMCTDLERCSDQALNIATAMVQREV